VVAVIAVSRAIAEDGCDLVTVDYEPLDPIVDIDAAVAPGAALLFEDAGTNVFHRTEHTYGDVDAAFARAAHVITERFEQHRHANAPMECRGSVASFDPASGELEITSAHQNPQQIRLMMAAALGHPAHQTRVLCGDIGGSFGQKSGLPREDVVIGAASMMLGQPVKWAEDRYENLAVGGQAREERLDVSAAVDADGQLLGLRVTMTLDHGAYPMVGYPASGYASLIRALLPSAYRLDAYSFESVVVGTNKAMYIPYRGPWEVETWLRERLFDVIAREIGMDPVAFRFRNLLRDDEMPTKSCTGVILTGITQRQSLTEACEHIDYEGFRAEQQRARTEGRYLGIGIANYVEPAPVPPSLILAMGSKAVSRTAQKASLRLEPDGSLTVFTSQQPHGQGHETTLAQLVADEFGVPMETVRVVHGDTMVTPFNLVGTGGSRAATLASGATIGAARLVKEQMLGVASRMLEVDPADLEFSDGSVVARGAPSLSVTVKAIATAAYYQPGDMFDDGGAGIEATHAYVSEEGTWSQATHCATVEVDIDTGLVKVLRFVVVEDCGSIINPAIVDGQIRGGVAQGIGAVLLERSAYGDDGQYLAGTFMDYLLPTATDIPRIEIHHIQSPPVAEVNFRGVGEGGAIGAPAALTNAIEDALTPFGARVREQHLPPCRILELCGLV
jgi:carbon-monoxide dehydrogenase large subunit